MSQVTERKKNACNDREDREQKSENGQVALDGIDKSDNALERDENAQNEKNDAEEQPTAEDDNKTDRKADRAATQFFLMSSSAPDTMNTTPAMSIAHLSISPGNTAKRIPTTM